MRDQRAPGFVEFSYLLPRILTGLQLWKLAPSFSVAIGPRKGKEKKKKKSLSLIGLCSDNDEKAGSPF